MKTLSGKVALVAGATRGAGRGIACMLGEAGATVYCSGRSVRGRPATGQRPETIEETAEMVSAFGGEGHYIQADHTDEAQVVALFERIKAEQEGLDILVNDIWGGDALTEWGKPFWELDWSMGQLMQERAVHTHIITSRQALPLMLPRETGLIVEITDGDQVEYRGNLTYDLAKSSAIRLAYAMSCELRASAITALALTPGFLRSEEMLDGFGVREENWKDAVADDPHFIASETPFFVGRAVAALAADPHVKEKAGGIYTSWDLAREYGFVDMDGRRPDWGAYREEHLAGVLESYWPTVT
jgi:NAD(P)-dependent dehydrogenase (short-subunit alcohol dehydrogenase family)